MIKIQGLIKGYGTHEVLKGIDIDVNAGEIYGFIGQNGAGKSTTMMILAGLMDFQSGTCTIDGEIVKRGKNRHFKQVGYLPEEPRFYLYMNAWEYLTLIGESGGMGTREIKVRSGEVLEMVSLTKDAKRPIGNYSRGMKQRLGMAVAMFHDPKVLLLDEPSSALDPIGREDVVTIIENLKARGKTIFLSTHILNDIERVCDRIGVLQGGHIVVEDSLDAILKAYSEPIYDITLTDVTDVSSLMAALEPFSSNILSVEQRKPSLEAIYRKVVASHGQF